MTRTSDHLDRAAQARARAEAFTRVLAQTAGIARGRGLALISGSDRDRDPEIWIRYRAFPGVVPLVTRLVNPVGPHTLVEQVELVGLRPKGVPPAKIDGLAVRGLFAPAPIVDVIDQRERERGSDSPLGRLTDQEFRALFE